MHDHYFWIYGISSDPGTGFENCGLEAWSPQFSDRFPGFTDSRPDFQTCFWFWDSGLSRNFMLFCAPNAIVVPYYVSPYWSRNDPIYQVIFSTVLVPYKMHAESWELDLNSEFRVLTSWISLTLSSTIQNACNNKNDLKVGIDFQCSMNMVPKCRAQFMHDWIPAVLSARTRDCRRRPDLIARAENHNSTQPGCHVASRTRSTDLQKMTWYFRSFPVRG